MRSLLGDEFKTSGNVIEMVRSNALLDPNPGQAIIHSHELKIESRGCIFWILIAVHRYGLRRVWHSRVAEVRPDPESDSYLSVSYQSQTKRLKTAIDAYCRLAIMGCGKGDQLFWTCDKHGFRHMIRDLSDEESWIVEKVLVDREAAK